MWARGIACDAMPWLVSRVRGNDGSLVARSDPDSPRAESTVRDRG
jgi:hypothetical protein